MHSFAACDGRPFEWFVTSMADRKSILVTGASSGIGEVTARVLVERGFYVFAGVRRAEDGARLRTVRA